MTAGSPGSPRQVRSSRALRAVVAVAACVVLAATGCAPADDPGNAATGGTADARGLEPDVDVATPELRRLRKSAGMAPCPTPTAPPAEGGLPDVTLPCLGGGEDVRLSSLRGPMVVNLWASWCGPCREELPYYQQLHERAGDRLSVLGIDYEDVMPGQALALAKETGVTYPSLADPGGELKAPLRVRGLPGVVLVDEQGRVVHREYVVIESYDQLAGLVEEHLDVSVGAAG